MAQVEVPEVAGRGSVLARVEAFRAFLEGVRAEIRKVAWPTKPELMKATRMILILSFVLGVVIGLVDWLLQLILVSGLSRLLQ
jgi:preprotein translocase subunit SecE